MATNKTTEINKIVARCRRIDWPVEVGNGRQAWIFRITMPNNERVQIHGSPSDRNWKAALMRQLEAGGFTEAENAWLAADEKRRTDAIAADRKQSEVKARKVAKQAKAIADAAGEFGIHSADVNWLLTPAAMPQTRAVLMSPEVAQKVLDEANTLNRPIREGHVAFLAQVIDAGEWACTHQGIAIDSNGILQDGQHRLLAIVRAGCTVPIGVTVGADPANFRKIDVGSVRTARDIAALRGEVNTSPLVSTARMLLMIGDHGPEAHLKSSRSRMSLERIDTAIIAMGDDLRHAVQRAAHIRREIKINITGLSAAIYRIGMKLPEHDPRVDAFLFELETGIGIEKAHPVWLARRLFIRSRDVMRRGGLGQWESFAYLMKAWNLRARGTTMSQLVWRSNEPLPVEPFLPKPIEK